MDLCNYLFVNEEGLLIYTTSSGRQFVVVGGASEQNMYVGVFQLLPYKDI